MCISLRRNGVRRRCRCRRRRPPFPFSWYLRPSKKWYGHQDDDEGQKDRFFGAMDTRDVRELLIMDRQKRTFLRLLVLLLSFIPAYLISHPSVKVWELT